MGKNQSKSKKQPTQSKATDAPSQASLQGKKQPEQPAPAKDAPPTSQQAKDKDPTGDSAPKPTVCDRCKLTVTPIPDSNPGVGAHVIAAVLCIFGLPCLSVLPYCFSCLCCKCCSGKCWGTPVTRCPRCGNYIDGQGQAAPPPNDVQSQSQSQAPNKC